MRTKKDTIRCAVYTRKSTEEGLDQNYNTLLAPDIIQSIMNGTQPRALTLQNVIRGFPVSWREQRDMFGFAKP